MVGRWSTAKGLKRGEANLPASSFFLFALHQLPGNPRGKGGAAGPRRLGPSPPAGFKKKRLRTPGDVPDPAPRANGACWRPQAWMVSQGRSFYDVSTTSARLLSRTTRGQYRGPSAAGLIAGRCEGEHRGPGGPRKAEGGRGVGRWTTARPECTLTRWATIGKNFGYKRGSAWAARPGPGGISAGGGPPPWMVLRPRHRCGCRGWDRPKGFTLETAYSHGPAPGSIPDRWATSNPGHPLMRPGWGRHREGAGSTPIFWTDACAGRRRLWYGPLPRAGAYKGAHQRTAAGDHPPTTWGAPRSSEFAPEMTPTGENRGPCFTGTFTNLGARPRAPLSSRGFARVLGGSELAPRGRSSCPRGPSRCAGGGPLSRRSEGAGGGGGGGEVAFAPGDGKPADEGGLARAGERAPGGSRVGQAASPSVPARPSLARALADRRARGGTETPPPRAGGPRALADAAADRGPGPGPRTTARSRSTGSRPPEKTIPGWAQTRLTGLGLSSPTANRAAVVVVGTATVGLVSGLDGPFAASGGRGRPLVGPLVPCAALLAKKGFARGCFQPWGRRSSGATSTSTCRDQLPSSAGAATTGGETALRRVTEQRPTR